MSDFNCDCCKKEVNTLTLVEGKTICDKCLEERKKKGMKPFGRES